MTEGAIPAPRTRPHLSQGLLPGGARGRPGVPPPGLGGASGANDGIAGLTAEVGIASAERADGRARSQARVDPLARAPGPAEASDADAAARAHANKHLALPRLHLGGRGPPSGRHLPGQRYFGPPPAPKASVAHPHGIQRKQRSDHAKSRRADAEGGAGRPERGPVQGGSRRDHRATWREAGLRDSEQGTIVQDYGPSQRQCGAQARPHRDGKDPEPGRNDAERARSPQANRAPLLMERRLHGRVSPSQPRGDSTASCPGERASHLCWMKVSPYPRNRRTAGTLRRAPRSAQTRPPSRSGPRGPRQTGASAAWAARRQNYSFVRWTTDPAQGLGAWGPTNGPIISPEHPTRRCR